MFEDNCNKAWQQDGNFTSSIFSIANDNRGKAPWLLTFHLIMVWERRQSAFLVIIHRWYLWHGLTRHQSLVLPPHMNLVSSSKARHECVDTRPDASMNAQIHGYEVIRLDQAQLFRYDRLLQLRCML